MLSRDNGFRYKIWNHSRKGIFIGMLLCSFFCFYNFRWSISGQILHVLMSINVVAFKIFKATKYLS